MKMKMARFRRYLMFFVLGFSVPASFSQGISDYLMRAAALNSRNNSNEAVSLLNDAISKTPDSKLLIMRAEAFIDLKLFDKAAADLNTANIMTAGSATYELARVYALKGDRTRSLGYLEAHFTTPYKRSEKEIMLDDAFAGISNSPEWRAFWKKERYNGLERGISEVEFYLATGNIVEAAEILNTLQAEYPDYPGTLFAKAMLRNSEGSFSESVKLISQLTEEYPENIKYLSLLADGQMKSGNNAGASVTFGKIIGIGVSDATVLLKRAACFMETGEYDRSMNDVDKYLSYYPGSRDALRQAGRIKTRSGDNLGSIGYFSENVKIHPDDPLCYSDRANSYFSARSWDLAIRDYSMSLDLDPLNAEAWLNKGIAVVNIGKPEDACHDFRRALSLGNKKATSYISRYCIK